jgi:multicomponent Na+:H+ antiporter subunit D
MNMGIINSPLPLYCILISLFAIPFIFAFRKKPDSRETFTIAAAIAKFILALSMVSTIKAGVIIEYQLFEIAPGLALKFRVDSMGLFFGILASFLWIITSFYSIGYVRALKEHAQTRYFIFFAVALSATMGVAFSANLFTTFIFYEIITLSTFPLVAHKETKEAMAGARKYLIYLLGTSIAFFLFAIMLTYNLKGTIAFSTDGIFSGTENPVLLTFIFVLFVAGTAKAGIMPFHAWLPAAMVAPTPVSALLHAVAVVKAGVFVVLRIVLNIFGIKTMSLLGLDFLLASLASFTIIAASIMALKQNNLKLRLAYSTVSQLSYIILGVALLSPSGIKGSIMHIATHAFGKITLFFTAGAIYAASHKTEISELNGIGKTMPFTMAAFTIGALSMIGIPGFGGFISKWFIAMGTIESRDYISLSVIAVSTILNACYFLPIVYAAFFKQPAQDVLQNTITEAPLLMLVPLLITAFGAVLLFFFPSFFLDLAQLAARTAAGG